MKNIALKSVLTLLVLLPVISSVLFTAYFAWQWVYDLEKAEISKSREMLAYVATANEYNMVVENKKVLQEISQKLARDKRFPVVTFYSAEGNVLATSEQHQEENKSFLFRFALLIRSWFSPNDLVQGIDIPVYLTEVAADDEFSQLDNHTDGKTLVGRVYVEMSLLPLIEKQLAIVAEYIAMLLIILLLLFFASRKILHFVTEQIARIQSSVLAIAEGQYHSRVHTTSLSELNALAKGVNKMADKIEFAQQELYEKVEQATHDLQEALKELELKNVLLDLEKEKAEQRTRSKTQFLAHMSHEIRTPMNSIIGFTDMLLSEALNDSALDKIKNVRDASQGLLALINNILDVSEIESGKVHVNWVETNIDKLLDEVYRTLIPMAEHKSIELLIESNNLLDHNVMVDDVKLRQILINFANNAIKFTKTGSVRIKLDVKSNVDKAWLTFHIIDTGVGMTADEQQLLFKEFSQVNKNVRRQYGGSGLGLYLSKQLLDAMGGRVALHKSNKDGSHFIIQLVLDQGAKLNAIPACHYKQVFYIGMEQQTPLQIMLKRSAIEVLCAGVDKPERLQKDAVIIAEINLQEALQSQIERIKAQKLSGKYKKILYTTPIYQCKKDLLQQTGFDLYLSKTPSVFKLINKLNDIYQGKKQNTGLQTTVTNLNPANKKKVLAVDDNPTNLKVIEGYMDHNEYQLTQADNAEEAIRLCKKYQYDIILMDVQMPGMTGLEASEIIRKLPGYQKTPILALTADVVGEARQRVKNAGMNELIAKPVTLKQFRSSLSYWTRSNHAEQQPTPESRIYQPDLALKMTDGDQKLADGIIEIFMQNLPEQEQGLQQAIEQQDLEKIHFFAHKLHSAVCYCGMPELQKLAKQTEDAAREGNKESLEMAQQILQLIERLKKEQTQ